MCKMDLYLYNLCRNLETDFAKGGFSNHSVDFIFDFCIHHCIYGNAFRDYFIVKKKFAVLIYNVAFITVIIVFEWFQ